MNEMSMAFLLDHLYLPALAIVVPILVWIALAKRFRQNFNPKVQWIEWNKLPKIITVLLWLLFVAGSYAYPYVTLSRDATLASIGILGVMALFLSVEIFGYHVGFDDEYLYCYFAFIKKQTIPWKEIKSAHYTSNLDGPGAWILKTRTMGSVRVPRSFVGFSDFQEALAKNRGIEIH